MNCVKCGQKIDPERLEVLPDTKLCTACSQKNPAPPKYDPNEVCSKGSVSARNGFAPQE